MPSWDIQKQKAFGFGRGQDPRSRTLPWTPLGGPPQTSERTLSSKVATTPLACICF